MGVAKQLARRRGEVCAGEQEKSNNYPGYRVSNIYVSAAGTAPGPPRTLDTSNISNDHIQYSH